MRPKDHESDIVIVENLKEREDFKEIFDASRLQSQVGVPEKNREKSGGAIDKHVQEVELGAATSIGLLELLERARAGEIPGTNDGRTQAIIELASTKLEAYYMAKAALAKAAKSRT